MKKQTAVEWLAKSIQEHLDIFVPGAILDNNMIEQAKAMEKEQIKYAYLVGFQDEYFEFEEYYKETYENTN